MLKTRMRAKPVVVVLALLLVLSLAVYGCGKKKITSEEPYKIGAVLSLSGPNAPLGQPEERSLKLLQKQINAEGGINGHRVTFIIEDDMSDPAKASTAIAKLITQDNVAAVIGSSGTGTTLAMAPIAEREKVAQVCCAAGTKITQPVNKWIFRTPPTDSMAIEKVLQYLKSNLKVSKIAILHDANAFGVGGADELTAKAPGKGVEIVTRESYGSTDVDMTTQLTKIKDTPAQALVVWGTNPGPAIITKNMQQLGIKIPFVGSHGIANKKFIELAGPAGNGVVFPAGRMLIPSSIPADSEWRKSVDEFIKDYKAAYNADPDTFAGHGWDAGLIITDAMKTANTDRVQLRSQIEKTKDLAGIGGVFTYSPTNHDGLDVNDLIMVKVDNGAWTEVK